MDGSGGAKLHFHRRVGGLRWLYKARDWLNGRKFGFIFRGFKWRFRVADFLGESEDRGHIAGATHVVALLRLRLKNSFPICL